VGILSGVDRTYSPKLFAALDMDAIPATFEGLPYILEAGVKFIGTGAADGVGTGKVYDYTFPDTAVNTIKTYTLEGGDNQEVEEMEYGHVESFTLEGRGGEAWTMAANWRGRQVTVSAFTGGLTIPAVEEMLFSKTRLYIDLVSAAYGTTLKSNTLLAASLKVNTGWVPVFTGDGSGATSPYFTFAKCTPPEIVLDVTFEHDGTSAAEKVLWRAGTPRLIQLKCEGTALGTPGTLYTYKTMIINLAGRWEKFTKLDEQDGNDIVTGTFRARYNATKADIGEIIVVNLLATIP